MQHPLLSQPHLSVISMTDGSVDAELARIGEVLEHEVEVEGRGDLEALLGRLLHASAASAPEAPPTPKTLDLIGLSTPDRSLLVLGAWVIDMESKAVRAFFRELAELEVLPRLGITAVRLLGARTAETRPGRETITKLAELLGVEVLGTRGPLRATDYDARGLRDEAAQGLASSYDLKWQPGETIGSIDALPYGRMLDVDALPVSPLPAGAPWPVLVATHALARELLRLVRRAAGAAMPGMLTGPDCEIALPAPRPGGYYLVQVMFGGELVRVYPEGPRRPGVVYLVDDPAALRTLIERLRST